LDSVGEAVITGASAGIGRVFAERLARRGHDLVLVARRAERLESLAAEVESAHGVRAEALPADLTNDADLRRVEARIESSRRLGILVNAAGFGTLPDFHEEERLQVERMLRLHILAVARLTHAALQKMLPARCGAIVNVSSMAAFFQSPGGLLYCSTKAWMNSFTEGLHLLVHGTGVKVQALCPGFTLTEFHDAMGFDRSLVPGGWWQRAEDVVAASLDGLEKGRVVVVPGLRYKFLLAALALTPRPLYRWLRLRRHGKLRRLAGGASGRETPRGEEGRQDA